MIPTIYKKNLYHLHLIKVVNQMEQSQVKEILNALSMFSEDINKKIDEKIDQFECTMEKPFDRLDKKVDGLRVDLTETQETVDYLASKSLQHEKKIHTLSTQ